MPDAQPTPPTDPTAATTASPEASATAEPAAHVVSADAVAAGSKKGPEEKSVGDFRQAGFLSSEETRHLRALTDTFCRANVSALASFLRADVSFRLESIESLPFSSVLKRLEKSTYLVLFRYEPFPQQCLLEMEAPLAGGLLNRILGNEAKAPEKIPDFTELETMVMEQLLVLIGDNYAKSWSDIQKIKWKYDQFEPTTKYLKMAMPGEGMLLHEFTLNVNSALSGKIRFMLPYAMMRPWIETLAEDDSAPPAESKSIQLPQDPTAPVYGVPVDVSAHWRGFQIPLGTLKHLSVGDTLLLDKKRCEMVQMDLGNRPQFHARMQQIGDQLFLKIESKIN